jgi:ankyrin repeat protein
LKYQLDSSLFGRKLFDRRDKYIIWGFLLRLLIQAGYELNVQDHDGWTPLHAAAHWGVKEACSILAEALCDMDIRNKLVSELEPLKGR